MGIKKIPVFKRNDYIREFETVVKQEIASHNKKVEESNERLNDFQRLIDIHRSSVNDKLKQLEDYCTNLRKHFDKTYDSDQKFEKSQETLKNLERSLSSFNDQLKALNIYTQTLPTKDSLEFSLSQNSELIMKLIKTLQEQISTNKSYISKLGKKVEEEQEKRSNDVLKFMTNINYYEDMVDDLMKKVNESTLNSLWAAKDMRKKQKSIFVLEKKFEFLDNKINNLKEKSCE